MHESTDNCDSDDLIEISPRDEHDAFYSYGHDANINDACRDELAIVPYVKNEIIAIAPILDSSLNEKHDCNNVIINSINVNYANNMQNYELGDDNFVISTTYCNDHDWGDNASYDLENLFNPHDEYVIDNNVCNNIKSGFGEVMTLVDVNPTILKDYKTFMHVDQEDNTLYDAYIVEFDYDPTCN